MSYFQDTRITLDLMTLSDRGLREAQIGASTALLSHFTLREDPALVVMPTGSGKTLVLILCAFLFRARRVLVVVPTTALRSQVCSEFVGLSPLRKAGVIPKNVGAPLVREVRQELTSAEAWLALQDCDVAVGLPNCISSAYERVVAPPEGLFDLILVDEAHHSTFGNTPSISTSRTSPGWRTTNGSARRTLRRRPWIGP